MDINQLGHQWAGGHIELYQFDQNLVVAHTIV